MSTIEWAMQANFTFPARQVLQALLPNSQLDGESVAKQLSGMQKLHSIYSLPLDHDIRLDQTRQHKVRINQIVGFYSAFRRDSVRLDPGADMPID